MRQRAPIALALVQPFDVLLPMSPSTGPNLGPGEGPGRRAVLRRHAEQLAPGIRHGSIVSGRLPRPCQSGPYVVLRDD